VVFEADNLLCELFIYTAPGLTIFLALVCVVPAYKFMLDAPFVEVGKAPVFKL